MKKSILTLLLIATAAIAHAADRTLQATSPNGAVRVELTAAETMTFTVFDADKVVSANNCIGLNIRGKGDVTRNAKVVSAKTTHHTETIDAPFYRNPQFTVAYTLLRVQLQNGIAVEWRIFDDGVAYRFVTTGYKNKEYIIDDEIAEFHFADAGTAYLPYSTNHKKPQAMAFQATYDAKPLAEQPTDNLAFLPATFEVGVQAANGEGTKLTLLESDLEDYPGMFIRPQGNDAVKAWFSRYPKAFDHYAWRVQRYVTETEDFIARCRGNRTFPWRILAISHADVEMPVSNLVYALAADNRIGDTSWIQPGLVAWDWWNDWGLSHVPFKAGINQETYKYYIDFAAQHHLPYIILDEGWYDPKSGDMLTTISDIQLPKLVEYGRQKGVRIILWTVFNVLDDQLEEACRKYADMGIAGFKVDFLDRDDQLAVQMTYRIAEACAKHHLLLDYHGVYPPKGMFRTFPHVINFESVFGMEEVKWTKHDEKDMPRYDVTFPFIRQQAGNTDFTPGGMRNATRQDFQPVYNHPMTMGTRCHQLAMYIVHDSPLTMLADSPTDYEREPEYTNFLASLPTVFDETRILQGKIGEYIITARRKGTDWYVAGQTNWDECDITLSLDFLTSAQAYTSVLFTDGINANKTASDYQIITADNITTTRTMNIHMASGGGFLLKLTRNN